MATQSAPRRRLDPHECEVSVWRGYLKSKFYARCYTAEGHQVVIAESPAFRFRTIDASAPSERVKAAHDDLLAELRAEGWEVVDRGSTWYRTRLRRSPEV